MFNFLKFIFYEHDDDIDLLGIDNHKNLQTKANNEASTLRFITDFHSLCSGNLTLLLD